MGSVRIHTEDYIQDCIKIHGDVYDYSVTKFVNIHHKLKIICRIHGEFEMVAYYHKRGDTCIKCRKENSIEKRKKYFIERANIVHESKYDYSNITYIDNSVKVEIVCPSHGIFSQTPGAHLSKMGCPTCGKIKTSSKFSADEFFKRAHEKHNGKYTYDKNGYYNTTSILTITCPIHGEFNQKASIHLKSGCQGCAAEIRSNTRRSNTEEFISKAKEIHGDKYDYSLVEYRIANSKIEIICPIHGIFMQKPATHIYQKSGCLTCSAAIDTWRKSDYVKLSEYAKLYIVLLEYGEEKFYKIGRTKNTIHERLHKRIAIYNYSIVNEYENKSGYIFDLEIELHRKYFKYKYSPEIKFEGHTECYRVDLPIEEIIKIFI